MMRPLHFFGSFGAFSVLAGLGISFWLLMLKLLRHQHVLSEHGPWFIMASVLILAGVQLIGIGLLGELQVRHYHSPQHRAPYTVERIVRLRSSEETMLS
jgi:hypothetical protein